jgi:uncharacterized membrane protein YdjX (TVP38/TMEM64 family)
MATVPETSDRPAGGRKLLPRALLLGLIALAVAAAYFLGAGEYLSWEYLRGRVDGLRAWVGEHRLLAVLTFFAVYAAATALSLPVATGLSLIGGAFFDFWLGLLVVSFASTLGATLAFLTVRYLFRDAVQRRLGDRLGFINRGVEADGAYYLLALRLTLVVPFFVLNAAMGLTRMRAGTFWVVSQVGMLPVTAVYVNAGVRLGHLASPRDVLSLTFLLSLFLVGLVPLLLRLLVRRLRTKAG